MREELAQREGLRGRFTAVFARRGKKRGFDGRAPVPTALFVDVRDEAGQLVADHLWFTVGVQIAALDLQPRDAVGFEARVTQYWKGRVSGRYDDTDWQPQEKDYRLSWPTGFRKLSTSGPETKSLPLFQEVEPSCGRPSPQAKSRA
jgi:hypothetical protein